jgi:hypothetical protein
MILFIIKFLLQFGRLWNFWSSVQFKLPSDKSKSAEKSSTFWANRVLLLSVKKIACKKEKCTYSLFKTSHSCEKDTKNVCPYHGMYLNIVSIYGSISGNDVLGTDAADWRLSHTESRAHYFDRLFCKEVTGRTGMMSSCWSAGRR